MSVPCIRATCAASFTRPADTTAYASGDLVANNVTAGSVTPMTFKDVSRGPGLHTQIRRVRINKTGTGVTNASFRVHLFDATSITCANGDNGAISTNRAANYLGQVDVTVGQAFTDGASGQATCEINAVPSGNITNIIGLIEARGAYTPISGEVFTVILEAACD